MFKTKTRNGERKTGNATNPNSNLINTLNPNYHCGLLADSKKDAEEGFKREISGVQDNVEEACQSEEDGSKLGKWQRKRKNFGKEFELGESEEELDATDDKDKDGIKYSLDSYYIYLEVTTFSKFCDNCM